MNKLEYMLPYMQNFKVLFVEDNQLSRDNSMYIFEELFAEVIVAVDGEDGFEKFLQHRDIDLIITDINMPRLNGMEMIAKIREMDTHISIVILSAYTESEYFLESIKYGVDGYMFKPINLENLLLAFDKVVEKLQLQKETKVTMNLLQQYQDAVDYGSIVSKTDIDGVITYVNDQFCSISGYSRDELIGKTHAILKDEDSLDVDYKKLKVDKNIWQGIIKNKSKKGVSYYVSATIQPILNLEGEVLEFISLSNDVTEIMSQKRQFLDMLNSIDEPLVIYMKVQDFNILEEFYSDVIIDEIDDKILLLIEKYIPKNYIFSKIYQLDNCEYVVVCNKEICLKNLDDFFYDLKYFQTLIKSKTVNVQGIKYDASIIMSIVYDDIELLESMKLGMKELIKTKQKFIISNDLTKLYAKRLDENIKIIEIIKEAILTSNVFSYFQPIVNNATKEIDKYESLVRIIDKKGELILPDTFLDISKRGRFYSQITSIVLDNSFNALNQTTKDISINLSILDIDNPKTIDKLFFLLEKHRNDAHRIILELLEDEDVVNFQQMYEFIKKVKTFGVKIAIDDFGSGYSNFRRLLDYQPDIIKIDGTLIKNILTNELSFDIVETIVGFAKKQKIKIVAEYVKDEDIFKVIKDLGIDYSQGYYFGKANIKFI